MRICSWDVGIKNLAYCIIEKKEGDNSIDIIGWGKINLIDSDKIICSYKMKNGKGICGKKGCVYHNDENGERIIYCNMHSKYYKPLEEGWDKIYMKEIDKKSKIKCMYDDKCEKGSKYECDGKNYCTYHSKMKIKEKERANSLIKIKKTNASCTNLQILGKNICKKLDAIKEVLNVDEIIIENQPSLKNPSMKTVGSFLFQYNIIRTIESKTNVKFISAANKLKIDNNRIEEIIISIDENDKIYKLVMMNLGKILKDESKKISNDDNITIVRYVIKFLLDNKITKKIVEDPISKNMIIPIKDFLIILGELKKNGYGILKELSIRYTKMIIPEKWKGYLEGEQKKDDLCDALLQGVYYINMI